MVVMGRTAAMDLMGTMSGEVEPTCSGSLASGGIGGTNTCASNDVHGGNGGDLVCPENEVTQNSGSNGLGDSPEMEDSDHRMGVYTTELMAIK